MLQIYNTLSRQKEYFKPLHEGHVGMYVCGPTVQWFEVFFLTTKRIIDLQH